MNVHQILSAKKEKRRLSAITCYDALFARLIDQTNIDIVLVGDSVGSVVLGFRNTLRVTMEHMIHHSAAVARVLNKPFLVTDMPFFSYKISTEQALENAGRLIQQGGAQAVKLEGGAEIAPQVKAIVKAGIPVMGHLGFTPQSIHALGGNKIQGKDKQLAQVMLNDALALQDAGVFALVLEMIPAELAKTITFNLQVPPTVGIGAGSGCDGQILVLHDMLGLNEGFNPKFLKKYEDLSNKVKQALNAYDQEVKSGVFPDVEHSFL